MDKIYLVNEVDLTAIAEVIRARKGTDALMSVTDFSSEIASITDNPIIAHTEDEVNALITNENIGKIIQYKGQNGAYLTNALYEIVPDADADIIQYYTENTILAPTQSLVYTLSSDGSYYIIGTGFTSIEEIEADTSVLGSLQEIIVVSHGLFGHWRLLCPIWVIPSQI